MTTVAGSNAPVPVVSYSVLGIAAIACVEVGLVALWVLLSMVRRGAIFDERAFRWVGVISVAGLAAAILWPRCACTTARTTTPPGSS